MVSRQAIHQRKNKANGKCANHATRKPIKGRVLCAACLLKLRKRKRKLPIFTNEQLMAIAAKESA